jgi:hypothetical protein
VRLASVSAERLTLACEPAVLAALAPSPVAATESAACELDPLAPPFSSAPELAAVLAGSACWMA